MLRNQTPSEVEAKKKELTGPSALERLLLWNANVRLKQYRPGTKEAIFRNSLADEELSVDLSVASKLDAMFKMLVEQKKDAVPCGFYFARELQAYVERGVSQYVAVLWDYYHAAFEHPEAAPVAPSLQFTIASPAFSD